jgi:integral membrane protein (TIGR01906 family)
MLLRVINILTSAIFILCIPLMLVTSTSRMALNQTRLYEYGYAKYEVSDDTGLDPSELTGISEGLIRYFNSPQELTVADYFSGQEISHLADVKNLLRLLFRVNEICLMVAFCYVAMGFILFKKKWWPMLMKRLLMSVGLTIVLFAVLGIALAIDFDGIFSWFHRISFDNLDWLVMPSDLLKKLYPDPFFFDAAMIVVIAVGIECLAIGLVSGVYLFYRKRRSVATVATGGGAGTAAVGDQ